MPKPYSKPTRKTAETFNYLVSPIGADMKETIKNAETPKK